MIKSLAFTLWVLLFTGVQVGAVPTVIQPPLHNQGATALTVHQGDNMNADGQVNVTITEAPFFGLILSPLTREDVERLQQYASELEGDTILDTPGLSGHHSGVFGLHSIMAKIADGIDAAREILHSASLEAASLWRLTPFTHQIAKFTPDVAESEDDENEVEPAFQDDAHYSAGDLRENQFDNTANLPSLEQIMSGLIHSHIQHSQSEQIEEAAEVQAMDAPSGLEDATHS